VVRFFPIVWAALRRQPVRSIASVLSIAAAFMLFGLLKGMSLGFDAWLAEMSVTRLYVQNRTLSSYGMPISHLTQIRAIDGVQAATTLTGMGGYYQDPKQSFGVAAIMDGFFGFFPEIQLSEAEHDAFWKLRTGAIVGKSLAAEYGWKVSMARPASIDNGSNESQRNIIAIRVLWAA
jgi:putative ABC transport system permease protein